MVILIMSKCIIIQTSSKVNISLKRGMIFMRNKDVVKIVMCALFAALACVATLVIQIPSPMNGFVNMGDCIVLLGAFLLGPIYGAAAGGIGSMLADIISGYAHYAPATLIIKALMGLVAGIIFKKLHKKEKVVASVAGGIVAEIIMVLGYFCYAAVIFGKGLGAAASVPGNIVQGVFGIVSSVILYAVISRNKAINKFTEE